jgi:hypothetical protein
MKDSGRWIRSDRTNSNCDPTEHPRFQILKGSDRTYIWQARLAVGGSQAIGVQPECQSSGDSEGLPVELRSAAVWATRMIGQSLLGGSAMNSPMVGRRELFG